MLTGRPELLIQAGTLLPSSTRYDTLNQAGLTALMIATIRNDEMAIQQLLDANADPNVEVHHEFFLFQICGISIRLSREF